jgi:hypothetical protein
MNLTKTQFVGLALVCVFMGGCCRFERRSDLPFPVKVSGWMSDKERSKFHADYGYRAQGEFVIKTGDSVEDGKIRVKVCKLIPPDHCAEAGSFHRKARVELQFIRMSDQKVLCETIIPERGGGPIAPNCVDSLTAFDIDVIGVYGINLKDGWAYIRL